ncbi:ADP-ribose pyrophosphatase [Limnobacter litoralis]|uniref:ADP-ribose pyrophosphatase n=2 Tax=Burkholderiaceae TaxID=119060 RepID=A0ABQ5YU42_9BURK|nr:ADP-ribose pyrophosphatase [Limnobacter litoralis]
MKTNPHASLLSLPQQSEQVELYTQLSVKLQAYLKNLLVEIPPMKYCSACATELVFKVPEGDNRERACCPQCKAIHYVNPKVVVGTVPVHGERILLCKRAIEPRYGYWTLPAGFMELNETTHEGALRETLEEAGAHVELGPPFTMFDVLRAEQVHLFFRATLHEPVFKAGVESLDVKLFTEDEIPWDEIAFKTVTNTLKLFFEDRRKGKFSMHSGDIYDYTDWPDNAYLAR